MLSASAAVGCPTVAPRLPCACTGGHVTGGCGTPSRTRSHASERASRRHHAQCRVPYSKSALAREAASSNATAKKSCALIAAPNAAPSPWGLRRLALLPARAASAAAVNELSGSAAAAGVPRADVAHARTRRTTTRCGAEVVGLVVVGVREREFGAVGGWGGRRAGPGR